MKPFRLKGLAELVEAIDELRQSVDTLSHFVRQIAVHPEGFGPPGDDEEHEPHHPPKKKGPKKKHPKKKGF